MLARAPVMVTEQEPTDTGLPVSAPREVPPPGEELEFYACLAEMKRLEALVVVYELLKEQPKPELEDAAINLLEVGSPLEASSYCAGDKALVSYALGKRLCDATDGTPVPEPVSTFCGR